MSSSTMNTTGVPPQAGSVAEADLLDGPKRSTRLRKANDVPVPGRISGESPPFGLADPASPMPRELSYMLVARGFSIASRIAFVMAILSDHLPGSRGTRRCGLGCL